MFQPKVVAIHQPNFLPWLGYFDKIARADVFILMDNVQFPKAAGRGNWSNRVRLLVSGQAAWVTVPVVRGYHGVRPICEMQIDNTVPWRARLLKTVRQNYARAPYLNSVFPIVERLVNVETDSLADYNIQTIRSLCESLCLNSTKLVLGTSLQVDGSATDLLIAMTKAVGGTAYLCGGGAEGYQEDEKFAKNGIELIYQNFKHPVYPQGSAREFHPGLSIVDALMWCGLEATRTLLGYSSFDSPGAPSGP